MRRPSARVASKRTKQGWTESCPFRLVVTRRPRVSRSLEHTALESITDRRYRIPRARRATTRSAGIRATQSATTMTNRFQKMALATTATTYLLVLVGALVRAAGAGMGCPDWPRCFGRWVAPTAASQVRAELVARFNMRLAWIEYLNRLLGATTGLLIFATLVLALRHYRRAPRVLWPSVGAFLAVGLAGWLGKKVVDHELKPALVTIHFFVALVVVVLLIYATVASYWPKVRALREVPRARRGVVLLSAATSGVLLVQLALGTRVRSALELAARSEPSLARGELITRVGTVDPLHRTLALALTAAVVTLAVYIYRAVDPAPALRRLAAVLVALVIAQVGAGAGLAYLALPPALQVVHVTLGSLMLGGLLTLGLLSSRVPIAPGGPRAAEFDDELDDSSESLDPKKLSGKQASSELDVHAEG